MKKTIFLFLALCLSTMLRAQSTNETVGVMSYLQKAMKFNLTVPQEKVYMHFDNTGYFENETMWFKAYVARTIGTKSAAAYNLAPSKNLSKVLYVELLNPSGDVIKTQKYPIDSIGTAYGDMKLDTLLGSGFYEVRAYTRYMTNWGVNACFSRVFPIFDTPKKEGDYTKPTLRTNLRSNRDVNNRDQSDSLYINAIKEGISTNPTMKTITARFYPEGGDLVVGKRGRVAVMVVDDNGRGFAGDGFVQNEKGEIVASVKTDSLGRGLFDVIPDGRPMKFQMRNIKNKTQIFNLPQAKQEGCVLNLDAISECPLVTLQATNGICGHLLGYVIINNGNIIHADTITAEPQLEIELDRERLAEGVNQITFFDSKGQIQAERLFFICPKGTEADSIEVLTKTLTLKPCGLTELILKTTPNANLSFTAIDAQTMTNGAQGSIKTWMLLSSEVRGYIHNVDYYFEADDEAHRKSADLLMLTQGWRRYDWNYMAGNEPFKYEQPIEDKFYIYGKLNEYRKRNKVGGVDMRVDMYNRFGESLSGKTTTDANGHYAFDMPFVNGEWEMQMSTSVNDKQKTYYIGIDRYFSPTPRFISPTEAYLQIPLEPNLVNKNTPEKEEFVPITKRDHLLDNVTVSAKRRYFTNDDWKYKNEGYGRENATVFYDIDKELDKYRDQGKEDPTLFELLCKLNAFFNNPDLKDLPTPPMHSDSMWTGRLAYDHKPIKWIINNGDTQEVLSVTDEESETFKAITKILGRKMDLVATQLHNDMFYAITSENGATGDDLFPVWPSEIKTAYIVPSSPYEVDGAVRIYLYTHKRFTTMSQKGLRHTYFQGFNTPETFKTEDYSVLPPMADFRRTIYWIPNVTTNEKGRVKVSFYNNSTCKGMYINVQGMSNDGHFLGN